MSAPIIQATYEQLEKIAQVFDEEKERVQTATRQVSRSMSTLKGGGWISTAATQFYNEFDNEISPAMLRLSSALGEASSTTRQIIQIVKQAEEEATAQLRDDGTGNMQLASFARQQTPDDERTDALTDKFRDRLNNPQQEGIDPVQAGMVGALPIAGGFALADGPLPIGDIIAIGILGTALVGGLILASSSESAPVSNPNVDQDKVNDVLGESEAATGNVTSGEALNDDEALEALGEWVGDDVEEISPGVFRSNTPNEDGTYNQGRIDNNSLQGNHPPNVPHIHLERVQPNPTRPGRWDNVSNNHIPLE